MMEDSGIHQFSSPSRETQRQRRRTSRSKKTTVLLLVVSMLIGFVIIQQTRLAIISTTTTLSATAGNGHGSSSTLSSYLMSWSIQDNNKNEPFTNTGVDVGVGGDDNDGGDNGEGGGASFFDNDGNGNIGGLEHRPVPKIPCRNENDDDISFSACLLVMDDNHFLIEWLAYHYHTLPLRYLVIAVDPRSKTSPKHVLDRWEHNMTIVRWNDKKFMSQKWMPENRATINENGPATSKFVLHRERQRHFYPTCLAALRSVNRSWTILIDIDEYITINHHYIYYNETFGSNKQRPPQQKQKQRTKSDQQASPPAKSATTKHTTILEAIRQSNQYYNYTDTACITMPRLRFGSYSDDDATSNNTDNDRGRRVSRRGQDHLPSLGNATYPFQESDFMTLRWHYRSGLHSRKDNRNPKSMVDLSLLESNHTFSRQDTDAHRPIRSVCLKQYMYIMNRNSPFVVHHYTGTIEQYNFRNDARAGLKQRNEQRYQEYQNIHDAYDDTISNWITSFITTYGLEQSNKWLLGVGNVSYVPPYLSSS